MQIFTNIVYLCLSIDIESMSNLETWTEDAAADTMGQWRKSRAAPGPAPKLVWPHIKCS